MLAYFHSNSRRTSFIDNLGRATPSVSCSDSAAPSSQLASSNAQISIYQTQLPRFRNSGNVRYIASEEFQGAALVSEMMIKRDLASAELRQIVRRF